jgi:LacI family transcriptional regulator
VLTFVGSSDEHPARERELVHGLCERRVDGLVLAPIEHNHAYLLRDLEAGMAVVFIDRPPQAIDADAVLIDNAGAAATAVDHLVAAGHRHIGFLGDREQIYTARERLSGYREALLRHGLTYRDELVRMGLDKSTRALSAAHDLFALARPPSALLTSQNFITVGAVHALQAVGRQHEVALVGIDDVAMADAIEPRLTVVAQDPLGMGRAAGELLFARLDGAAEPAKRLVMPTELLVRGSGEIRAPPD